MAAMAAGPTAMPPPAKRADLRSPERSPREAMPGFDQFPRLGASARLPLPAPPRLAEGPRGPGVPGGARKVRARTILSLSSSQAGARSLALGHPWKPAAFSWQLRVYHGLV